MNCMYTLRIKISAAVPLFLNQSVSPLSCLNIVFLFILSLGKYLPWATEAGGYEWASSQLVKLAALCLLMSVIGMTGSAACLTDALAWKSCVAAHLRRSAGYSAAKE